VRFGGGWFRQRKRFAIEVMAFDRFDGLSRLEEFAKGPRFLVSRQRMQRHGSGMFFQRQGPFVDEAKVKEPLADANKDGLFHDQHPLKLPHGAVPIAAKKNRPLDIAQLEGSRKLGERVAWLKDGGGADGGVHDASCCSVSPMTR
jgi:hypothetical protein